jgi:hypothetical protein
VKAPPKPDFDIATHWHLDATGEELTAVVLDPERLDVWCPTVFMRVELVARGRPEGTGMKVRLYTKGLMPHVFFFEAEIASCVPHRSMELAVSGDFEGTGSLRVDPAPEGGVIGTLRWRIVVKQPYLKFFVPLLRLVLELNHKWAVRRVWKLIQAEVWRRRSGANAETEARPTFPHNLPGLRAWQIRRSAARGWSRAAR